MWNLTTIYQPKTYFLEVMGKCNSALTEALMNKNNKKVMIVEAGFKHLILMFCYTPFKHLHKQTYSTDFRQYLLF